MTEIDQALRADIQDRIARRRAIEDAMPQYSSQHCRLCNWATNGLDWEETLTAAAAHEEAHPEYQEWRSSTLSAKEIRATLHDHECTMVRCACVCGGGGGCSGGSAFCDIFGALCAVCAIRDGRGDKTHGPAADRQDDDRG